MNRADEIMATSTLLAAVREGLAKPFVDPVHIRDLEFTRAEARAAERVLSRVLTDANRSPAPSPQEPVRGGAADALVLGAAAPVSDRSFHSATHS